MFKTIGLLILVSLGFSAFPTIGNQSFAQEIQRGKKAESTKNNVTMQSIQDDVDASRRESASKRGLPRDTTWEEIARYDEKKTRKKLCMEYDLSINDAICSTSENLYDYILEISRIRAAVKRNMPSDSSWKEINRHDSEIFRKRIINENNLPTDTSWEEIVEIRTVQENNKKDTGKETGQSVLWRMLIEFLMDVLLPKTTT